MTNNKKLQKQINNLANIITYYSIGGAICLLLTFLFDFVFNIEKLALVFLFTSAIIVITNLLILLPIKWYLMNKLKTEFSEENLK